MAEVGCGHLYSVLGEENIAAGTAEEAVPPRQQPDVADGEVGPATAVSEGIEARGPLGLNELHGTRLRFQRIAGADLHQAQEAYRNRRIDWQRDASTLHGDLIPRHAP